MPTEFYKRTYTLAKSIINQRLLVIKIDKSKVKDPLLLTKVEDLRNDFNKYSSADYPLASFLYKNYEKLKEIMVKDKGSESKIMRLREAYLESRLILNN